MNGAVFFGAASKADVIALLRSHHYIGDQCANPSFVFVWRRAGGLFGDCGPPCAAALFAPPAARAWGRTAIELTRLARDDTPMPPLTGLLSASLRLLRSTHRYEVVVSYADPGAGHHGGIYQAASWLYLGESSPTVVYVHKETGARSSQRSFDQSSYTLREWEKVKTPGKHTYAFPLTRKARRVWAQRAMPYPKPTSPA